MEEGEASPHTDTVAMPAIAELGFHLSWDSVGLGVRVVWIGAQPTVELFGTSFALPKQARCPVRPSLGSVRMVWAALDSSSRVPLDLVHCRRSVWRGVSEVPRPLVKIFPVTASWALMNDPRKFRASVGSSKHSTIWEAPNSYPCGLAAKNSGLIHCQHSGAGCGSPEGPLASTLFPMNLPWASSWACTQWCKRELTVRKRQVVLTLRPGPAHPARHLRGPLDSRVQINGRVRQRNQA